MADKVDYIFGIDNAEKMINVASNAAQSISNVQFGYGDIRKLKEADHSCDYHLVLSNFWWSQLFK